MLTPPSVLTSAFVSETVLPVFELAVRKVHPLSVIRGGIDSVAELKAHIGIDPVVRRAYQAAVKHVGDADLLDNLRPERVAQAIEKHTQLRDGEDLSWSDGPVTVDEGEKVFVHVPTGEPVVRARCGNLLLGTVPDKAVRRPAPKEEAPTPEPVPVPRTVSVEPDTGERTPSSPPEGAAGGVPPTTTGVPAMTASLPPGFAPMAELPGLLLAAPPPGGPTPATTPVVPPLTGPVPPASGIPGGGFPWTSLVPLIPVVPVVPVVAFWDHTGAPGVLADELPHPVPEPGSWALLTLAAVGIGLKRRRAIQEAQSDRDGSADPPTR